MADDEDHPHSSSPRPAALLGSGVQDLPADSIISLADTQEPAHSDDTAVEREPNNGTDRSDILADIDAGEIPAASGQGKNEQPAHNGHGNRDAGHLATAVIEQTPVSTFQDFASPRNMETTETRFDGLIGQGQPSIAATEGLTGWHAVLKDLGIKNSDDSSGGPVGKHWDIIRKKRSKAVQQNAVWKTHTINTATVRSNWGMRSTATKKRVALPQLPSPSWPSPDRYHSTSLLFLRLRNPLRKACIALIEQKWWDRIVLGLILLNTIALALYDPFDTVDSRPVSARRDALEWVSKVFAVVFTVECSVKVVALGLVGPKSYLSEAWNRLDLFIVVVGLLDLLPVQSTNLSALRSLRVMRPLRAVQRFPQLRFLVTLLLKCLPMLSNVLALCCFIFWVFGILAVQLVHGRMRGRCYDVNDGMIGDSESCTLSVGVAHCPAGETCLLLGDNPGMGTINFDTIGAAVSVIFRVMTLEGWTEMMYLVQDVYWGGSWIYFVVLVFLGPIFAIQLFLVIITSKFVDVRSHLHHKAHPHLKGKPQLERSAGGLEGGDSVDGTTGFVVATAMARDGEITRLESVSEDAESNGLDSTEMAAGGGVKQQNGHRSSWVEDLEAGETVRPDGGEADMVRQMSFGEQSYRNGGPAPEVDATSPVQHGDGTRTLPEEPATATDAAGGKPVQRETSWSGFKESMRKIEQSDRFANFVLIAILFNAILLGADHPCDPCDDGYCVDFKKALDGTELLFVAIFVVEMLLKLFTMGVYKYVSSRANIFDGVIVIASVIDIPGVITSLSCHSVNKPCEAYEECASTGVGLTVLRLFRLLRIVKLMKAFPEVQKQIRILISVTSSVAALIILIFLFLLIFCILGMNLFGAAISVHVDVSPVNLGSSVFLRLPWSESDVVYGTVVDMDHFNRSLTPWLVKVRYGTERSVQEALSLPPGSDGHFWAGVDGSAGLGEPEIVGVSPRSNYDDLATAAVSTFEVITLSNWYFQLHFVTALQGDLAGVYFYVIIVIGTWMLLNLFIAILIMGFAEQKAISYRRNMLNLRRTLVKKLLDLEGEDLPHKIDQLFENFDVDESGDVDMYELNEGLLKLGVDLRPPELAEVFSRFNTSGSGSFDFDDFITMAMHFCKDVDVPLEAFIKNPTPEQVSPEQATQNAEALAEFYRLGSGDDDEGEHKRKHFLKPAQKHHGAHSGVEELKRQAEQLHAMREDHRRSHSNLLSGVPGYSPPVRSPGVGLVRRAGGSRPRVAFDGNGRRMSLVGEDSGFSGRRTVAFDGNGRRMSLLGSDVRPAELPGQGQRGSAARMQPNLLQQGTRAALQQQGTKGSLLRQGTKGSLLRQGTRAALLARQQTRQGMGEERAESGVGEDSRGFSAAVAAARRHSVSAERVRRQSVALHRMKTDKKLSNPSLSARSGTGAPGNISMRAAQLKSLVENKWFERVVMLSILVGCVTLALDRPDIGSGSSLWRTVMITEFVILFIFTCEMVLKIAAYGARKYVQSGWNRLDAFIVVSSLIDVVITVIINPQYYTTGQRQGGLGALRVLRALKIFRAMRPLRVIALATGLKVLVSTLLSAVKPVMNTILIAFAIFSALAIMGQQFLAGKLNTCSDPRIFEAGNCHGLDEEGILRKWQRRDINFDNFGQSMRAVFTLATLDSWTQHMWAGVDATGRKTGPIENHSPELILYYVVCVIVGGFLVINIFVGVFVDCYSVASNNQVVERRARLDPNILRDVHDDPVDKLRRKVADVVSSAPFEMSIAFLIVLNILFMGMESYKQAAWQGNLLDVTNFFFTYTFTCELIAKMFAFKPRRYFMSNWNRFDYFVVVTSLFGIFADALGGSTTVNPTIIRIFRVFRIFRILRAFRIFKAARGLQSIIATLARSFPSILNLFGMMLLLFFIYSILGVTLFGELCVDGQERAGGLQGVRCLFTEESQLLNRHATFRNVGEGILTLFRVATGDAWGVIMERCSLEPPFERAVTDQAWADLRRFLGGVDPREVEPNLDPNADVNLPIEVAAFAIKQWNNTVFGMESDYYWPLPDIESTTIVSNVGALSVEATAAMMSSAQRPTPTDWVQLARNVLHRCLTDREALELQRRGLMDCSVDGFAKDCKQTCGDPWFGNIFFISFVCIANFVLLQLVIAVLMEQLERSRNPETPTAELMPGSKVLYNKVFMRMHRRWRWKAGLLETTLQGAISPFAVTQRHISTLGSLGGTGGLRSLRTSDGGTPLSPARRLAPREISVLNDEEVAPEGQRLFSSSNGNGHSSQLAGNGNTQDISLGSPKTSMNRNGSNGDLHPHSPKSSSSSKSPSTRSPKGPAGSNGVPASPGSFSTRGLFRKVYASSPASNAVASSYVPDCDGEGGAEREDLVNEEACEADVLKDVLEELDLDSNKLPAKTETDERENPYMSVLKQHRSTTAQANQ